MKASKNAVKQQGRRDARAPLQNLRRLEYGGSNANFKRLSGASGGYR